MPFLPRSYSIRSLTHSKRQKPDRWVLNHRGALINAFSQEGA